VRIALHVLERRAGDHRRIEIGPLVHRRADQHAAVRAAGNADPALGGDSGADQVLGDGVEIVEAALPLLAQRRLVPVGPIFAAAADVGEDIGIALLGPEQASGPAR
jgi:hypothetical protein